MCLSVTWWQCFRSDDTSDGYPYKRMPSAVLLNNPAKWNVGISDSGWQTQQTFYDYVTNIFYKWLHEQEIQMPVIVFIDGHKSHVSLTLSDFCAEHQIELIALYPNSTHLTQPMDVGVFKPLNVSWTNQAKDWRIGNQYAKIEKKDVAPILEKAINAINYSDHLKNAFKKSGIFPFDVENIDLSRVLPSVAESDSQEQLWNPQEEKTITSPVTIANIAVHRLQHFEQLMGVTLLNSFRASSNVWTGSKDYLVLFNIWKQMYNEASESISTESSDAVIVEELFQGVDAQSVNDQAIETQVVDTQFVVSSDGTWVMQELDTSTVEMNTTSIDTVMAVTVETLEVSSSLFDQCNPSPVIFEDEVTSEDDPNLIILDDVVTSEQCSVKDNESSTVTDAIVNSCDPEPNKTRDTFSPDAFKETFFWPAAGDPKTTKKKMAPKISSVMTSEDWRQHERLKMEEKQQQQAEKDARKASREAKKVESAKMAAQKLVLKEQKIAAAKNAAETKSQANTKRNKRSRKATPTVDDKKLKK